MRSTNTQKGEIRKLAQRAGMFTAMLEWPVLGRARFDLDSILTMFNEAPLQVRALKTNNLETKELPFLGTLLFVQNREPFATKAQKERVISLKFKTENVTHGSSQHLRELIKHPLGDFAMFFPFIMSYRTEIESKWYDIYNRARHLLDDTGIDARVRDNHALVLAFHSFLAKIMKFDPPFLQHVKYLATSKHSACCTNNETIADLFIDMVVAVKDDSETKSLAVNFIDYRPYDGVVWIYAAGALKAVKDAGFVNVNPKDLYAALMDHPAYVKNNHPHRFNDGVHKAWQFDAKKLAGYESQC